MIKKKTGTYSDVFMVNQVGKCVTIISDIEMV